MREFVLGIQFSDGSKNLLIFCLFCFYCSTYKELSDVFKACYILELKLEVVHCFFRAILVYLKYISMMNVFPTWCSVRSFEKQLMDRFFFQGGLENVLILRGSFQSQLISYPLVYRSLWSYQSEALLSSKVWVSLCVIPCSVLFKTNK